MDRIYYRDKIQEQLNDKQYYRELNDNMEKKTKRNINKLISKFPHCTTEKEVDYLTKFEVKTSNFYGLPKIHKSKEVETAVQQQNCAYIEINSPKDLKFRPIVAGPQCPTHRLSHFIDLILKPLCQYVPSFIRDNFDFLNHLPAEVKEDAILVSFDVTSLYTNIPHKLGLDAVKFWLESYRHIIDQRFSNNFLLEGLKIILDNNTFFFDGKYYLQISGTAMGTKVAPTYATLVMGFLEDKMYQQVESEFDTAFKVNKSSKRPNTQSRNPSPENFQQNNDEWKVVNNRGRGRGGRRGRGRGRIDNPNRGGRGWGITKHGGNSRGRGRGFKFAPVPYSNVPELKADINNFSRRLRLKEEFGNKKDHDKSLVRNKSTYTPRPGKDDYLDTYIETITKFPVRTRKCKQNLTRNEQDALKSLKDDDSIIIKEADKGGAIIIMDTDFYKEKVLEQLNDEEYYKQITNNPDKATKKRLKKLIKDYDQCLTEKEIAYLCDFDPKESNFYGLPKVHKSAQIQNTVRDQNNIYVETFRPADLKLRPIIAGPESLTQRLSHFIDLVIKHLCPSIPSYIKDDMEFLNHIPAIVPEETLLTSFDVTSLYTNIPHDLGLTAVKYWIEEKRDEIDSRFETNFILEATKIVLEENTFYFDGNKYRQIKGTAMGTKVAPTYANLVMGYLEQQMYNQNICPIR
ncbi:unnamed protein product [Mytilus edulis]|uniref:Reverse transcriptase domain-containing protein n=1 Tax=Mytilus edulis TaxID=6550 RepID=A0A8S3TXL4_MYTED|nr:unnamed protein product [Mytilus edulis]